MRMYSDFGNSFNDRFPRKLAKYLLVKRFSKSAHSYVSYDQISKGLFFIRTRCMSVINLAVKISTIFQIKANKALVRRAKTLLSG